MEQQPLPEGEQGEAEQQLEDPAAQEELPRGEQTDREGAPIYAELGPRAPPPQLPVRRLRSQRGVSDPQLPTRSSGRFSGQGGSLVSLPYSGRRI